jgi:hypothetical protein
MIHTSWFIPLCIVVSALLTLSVITLTVFTLIFRAKVIKKYDRGKHHD